MVEWLRSGAVVECDNETAVELARAVGWIRHDLEWAGMRINEEKSQWEVSQAGNESALHSRCLQQTAVRMEEEDSRCTEVAPSERNGLAPELLEKTGYMLKESGRGGFYGERGAMLEDLERELSRAGRTDLVGVARSALEGCVASSTLKNYSGADRARRRLAAACGLEEEADLSLCLFVLDAMAKKRSKSTVATAIAAFGYSRGEDPKESRFGPILKAAMRTAARSVPVSSHPKATREEVESILRWGTREGAGAADLRIAVITLFSFGTLLRPSEAVALKREDVSEKSGVGEKLILGVSVRSAKNDQEGKGRTSYFSLGPGSTGRLAWLRYSQFLAERSAAYLFPSINSPDTPVKSNFVRKELTRACAAAGIDRLIPHSLRGGGASASIQEGASLDQVQKRGRWRSADGMTPYIADSIETQGGTLSF
ncbi:hypothetical protein PENTCL1PPCAC_8737 [Pristionchus entomophagus]|uniref:Tyr recombinase domain-containing protein n=1 Tax=Pristionchus entomophagus TaxID=358040 RepID=A0AAV5ST66_9BILA|nr:hypothetical protein PENTCL1PPCAC_8737 [Pristionchus entomophagus]